MPKAKATRKTAKKGARKTSKKAAAPSSLDIKRPAIKRLVYAGAKGDISGISPALYGEADSIIRDMVDAIIGKAAIITESARRKTMKLDDLQYAIQSLGGHLYPATGKIAVVKEKITFGKSGGRKITAASKNALLKRLSEGLMISYKSFERVVRNAAKAHGVEKVSGVVLINLQIYVETEMVKMFVGAASVMHSAKRKRMTSDDLATVSKILKVAGCR